MWTVEEKKKREKKEEIADEFSNLPESNRPTEEEEQFITLPPKIKKDKDELEQWKGERTR